VSFQAVNRDGWWVRVHQRIPAEVRREPSCPNPRHVLGPLALRGRGGGRLHGSVSVLADPIFQARLLRARLFFGALPHKAG
jgi:hypothetical protein